MSSPLLVVSFASDCSMRSGPLSPTGRMFPDMRPNTPRNVELLFGDVGNGAFPFGGGLKIGVFVTCAVGAGGATSGTSVGRRPPLYHRWSSSRTSPHTKDLSSTFESSKGRLSATSWRVSRRIVILQTNQTINASTSVEETPSS